MDVARIAAALERAGIDPRTNATIAIVTALHQDAMGVHLDITTLTGIEETATVAPIYAGSGFGFYLPIDVGQAVIVVLPEGEWSMGARVIGQVWDQGDPPPALVHEHPTDAALVMKPGKTIRIVTSAGGDVAIAVEDGKVRLGSLDADKPIALAEDLADKLRHILGNEVFLTALGVAVLAMPAGPPASTAAAAAFANAIVPLFQGAMFGATKVTAE